VSPPDVVLLHGFATSSARTWGENGWFDLLAEAGRTPLGLDLLGHGTAAKPHDPEAYTDLEGDVGRRLPVGGPLDGIGFSLGAGVLLRLAAAEPGRFRRIVTLGVGANLLRSDPGDDGGDNKVLQALEGTGDPSDPVVRYFDRLASHPETDRVALAACIRAPKRPFTAEELAGVTVPVLVVIGDRDFAGPGDPLVEALPDARLVLLRGVDHFSTPKDFGAIDATLEFLT
jgi:pimeloyl-ACP methyl ester carboxylesterase